MSTSDAYLVSHFDSADVVSVRYQEPKKLAEKLGLSVLSALEAKATKWVTKVSQFRGY